MKTKHSGLIMGPAAAPQAPEGGSQAPFPPANESSAADDLPF